MVGDLDEADAAVASVWEEIQPSIMSDEAMDAFWTRYLESPSPHHPTTVMEDRYGPGPSAPAVTCTPLTTCPTSPLPPLSSTTSLTSLSSVMSSSLLSLGASAEQQERQEQSEERIPEALRASLAAERGERDARERDRWESFFPPPISSFFSLSIYLCVCVCGLVNNDIYTNDRLH